MTDHAPQLDRTHAARSKASGVIVTAAGPHMHNTLHQLTLPAISSYAERWGWAVHGQELLEDGQGADPPAQKAKWAKVGLLRQALSQYQLALWIDADVLILRTDEDIRQHLHPDAFQALALEQVPHEHRINPNTGVWLMRSCPAAFAFLDAIEAAGPQPGPWADQGAVLAALGWNRGDDRYQWARPGPGNPFLHTTSWLPPGWNQPHLTDRAEGNLYNSNAASYRDRPTVTAPHALHFMGMTPTVRHRAMAQVATDLGLPHHLPAGQSQLV